MLSLSGFRQSMEVQFSSIGRNRVKDYHINFLYSEEDEGYIADIPDLRHGSAFGATQEQALREVLIAKEAWIEAARSSGKSVPEPLYCPAIHQVARSGQRLDTGPETNSVQPGQGRV